MAVAHDNSWPLGIQAGEDVHAFLDARPRLRDQVCEALWGARRYFPAEPIRLAIERDPEDTAWESLVIEIFARPPLDTALANRDAYVDAFLVEAMGQYPGEIVAVLRAA